MKELTRIQDAEIAGDFLNNGHYEVWAQYPALSPGRWSCISRSAKTLDEARGHIQKRKEQDRNLRGFIDVPNIVFKIFLVTGKLSFVEKTS